VCLAADELFSTDSSPDVFLEIFKVSPCGALGDLHPVQAETQNV
jgi:hypothetical protein